MEIIFTQTQQVVSEQEFRNLYNTTSFPPVLTTDILADFNAEPVFEGEQAVTTSPYEYSFRNGVKQVNGKWFTSYVIGPIFTDNENETAEEQEAEYKARIDEQSATNVRNTRNQLLKDSDWTQITDVPVDQAAWATYRQALRDVTIQEAFPYNIEWPTQPNVDIRSN